MKLYLYLTTVLIPVGMMVLGWYMEKHPPKKINHFFGYRTPRSKASQAAWDFAQVYCGRFWLRAGMMSVLVTNIIMFLVREWDLSRFETVSIFVVFLQLIPLLSVIPVTEKALKQRFDD